MTWPRAVLIAGPTASGKSALALRLARERNGVVLNADSMQVYRELRILTARPTASEEAATPHVLFGHIPASQSYSVRRYLDDAAAAIRDVEASGRLPIIVGGTGLYFKALLDGLAVIPPIPDAIRERWRSIAASQGAGAIHSALSRLDPLMAGRLNPNDAQRMVRALEVFEATGRSLDAWQREPVEPVLLTKTTERLLVLPERAVLHERADRRFDAMMEAGALDEVRHLMELQLDTALPATRALGVAPLMAYLEGRLSLDDAVSRAKLETRQYIKRQTTWFKRNIISWQAT